MLNSPNNSQLDFMKLRYLLILFLFSSTNLLAQSSSILRFVVSEEDGQPIVSANVLLYEGDEEDYTDYGVTTRDGFVEFRGLRPGTYRIRVSFVGFETYEEYYEVQPSETKVYRLTLEESVGELEVQVIGEGNSTGGVGITRVRAEDLSRLPSASLEGDLMAYIQTMPGVISTGDQGGDLYIRGGTPAQNLVLVDNIPLVKPFHISNLFSAFPEKAVNDIQIMAGGFDNRYMSSTSAVIDVNLKTGNYNRAGGSASFSPYMSTVFVESPLAKGKSSLVLSGRKATINEFSGYLGTEKQEMDFYDVIARYTLQGEQFNCSASMIITGDEGKINETRNQTLSWYNTGAGLRCFGFDETFDHPFEVSMGFSNFNNSEGSALVTERKADVTQGYLRLDMQEELLNLRIDYGINILMQGYKARADERFTTTDDGVDIIDGVVQMYTKTKWQPSRWLAVEPGLGTQFASESKATLEPRVRIQYNPLKNNRMELSLATGLYAQTMEGITDQRDAGSTFTLYRSTRRNEPLPSAFHAIISAQNKLGRYWTTNVEAYYKDHKNTPVPLWTQETGVETEIILADGETYGVDLRLEFNNGPLFWYAGYGLGKVEYSAVGNNLGEWLGNEVVSYTPAHDQRHKFNTYVNYNFKGTTLSAGWEFGSGLPYTQIYATDLRLNIPDQNPIRDPGKADAYYDEPYTERLPVYHRLDVSVKRFFEINPRFKIGTEIGAINVYDRTNVFYLDVVEFEVVNQSRFLPYASVSMNLD